jgi:hypothetical protein
MYFNLLSNKYKMKKKIYILKSYRSLVDYNFAIQPTQDGTIELEMNAYHNNPTNDTVQ